LDFNNRGCKPTGNESIKTTTLKGLNIKIDKYPPVDGAYYKLTITLNYQFESKLFFKEFNTIFLSSFIVDSVPGIGCNIIAINI
jgi:hypothetical protein